jgi:hypothetical protein
LPPTPGTAKRQKLSPGSWSSATQWRCNTGDPIRVAQLLRRALESIGDARQRREEHVQLAPNEISLGGSEAGEQEAA